MKLFTFIRTLRHKWNALVIRRLRKVGIFKRLNISFLVLLLTSAFFLTFFSFFQYSREISLNLDRYTTMLVQNAGLKIQDTMKDYENTALNFYDDIHILNAVSENSALSQNRTPEEETQFQKNTFLIENRLYDLRQNQKYIVNIQFVTPDCQYHMVEENGFQRGGTIRDLDSFYQSEFYLLPQEKRGYPVWMDSREQTDIFYKNEQNVYGFANIITLGIAVYGPYDREFLGVLLFNIDPDTFFDAVEGTMDDDNTGNTFLIGKDGILHWFNPSINAPSLPYDPVLYQQMQSKGKSVERTLINGQNVLLAYEQIPGTGLFTCYVADLNTLMKHPFHIRNLCLLVLAGTVIACFILSYYVTFSISDPLKKLNYVMKKTGSGKWTARYENSGHDEITDLGNRFNEMAENTNHLIDQVYISEIRRQRTLLSWKNAQLDAMLMQINPHFLYNTLDTIIWLIEGGQPDDAVDMISSLSVFFRTSLSKGKDVIPLSEEKRHTISYLEIQQSRYRDILEFEIHIPEEFNGMMVPKLTLQPLAENALYHGIKNKRGGGKILIEGEKAGKDLILRVRDNGQGMTAERLHEIQEAIRTGERAGFGLSAVAERLRLYYGEGYGMKIESEEGKGTAVEVRLGEKIKLPS